MNIRVIKRNLVRFSLVSIALLAMLPSAAAQGKPSVYKIPEAGLQVDLPSGWEASKDPKGTHLILKKDAGGYVLLSMTVLPRDPTMNIDSLYAAFSEGIFEEAKKDWKGFKAADLIKDNKNGMAIRAQTFEGSMENAGGELEGLVVLIDSPKPLGVFGQRTKKHSDLLETEAGAILSSIAKIQ